MKRWSIYLLAPSLICVACDRPSSTTQTTSATTPAADNTKLNERDRGESITPMDQGNGAADLAVTQQIRQELMSDESLSTTAKNVKVITANGIVTLRGPVLDRAERAKVVEMARRAAGSNRVDDRLDVENTK